MYECLSMVPMIGLSCRKSGINLKEKTLPDRDGRCCHGSISILWVNGAKIRIQRDEGWSQMWKLMLMIQCHGGSRRGFAVSGSGYGG